MLNRIVIFLCFCLLPFTASATHLMGGEITWSCEGNGNYIFTLKLYRDCSGVPLQLPVSLRVHNHPSVQGIPLQLVSQTDISPQCNGAGPSITCEDQSPGSVEEFVFRSNAINLAGIPPPEGWIFTFDACCRNNAITNLIINPNETGFTLRAIMYAYNGENTSPCFDSSPVFTQLPAVIICVDNPFTYNHNAYDVDKDSLVYSFAQPLDWLEEAAFNALTPGPIPWQNTFSINSPFPGPTLNNSVPATLNSQSGEIQFTPQITGNFVTVVKVQSYRCGQLIAEVFREIQVVIIDCGDNSPPDITAPFQDPNTGQQTSFTTIVQAGDPVSFTMTAADNDISIIGIPQTMSITASGGQFGAGFSDPDNGCAFPPCATLSPAPPTVLLNNETITFNWQTSCDHVAIINDCFVPSSTYTFVITFQDDFCPTPFYRIATIAVVVTAPPVLVSPNLNCIDVDADGNTTLTWTPVTDPDGYFDSYHIFSSTSQNGQFTAVDSIFDLNQSTYNHIGAGADNQSIYYYIQTRSGCGGQVFSPPVDTFQSIYLDVNDIGAGIIDLQWNALGNPLPAGAQLPYQIERAYDPDPFVAFATSNPTVYQDNMTGCLQEIFYEIFLNDASGCVSSSNVAGGPFSNDEPPEPPVIDSISVQINGNTVYLGWEASPSADTEAYIIYKIENGITTVVDTVLGINTTSYIINDANPSAGTITYFVSALDECLEEGLPADAHTTILLDYEVNSCNGSVDLSWSEYSSWPGTADSYNILQRIDDGNFILVSNVPGSASSSTVPDLVQGSTYCFIVQAVSSAVPATSTSNTVCFVADVQDLPDFTYLRNATILNSGAAYSACIIDTSADISSFKVLRANYPGAIFDTLYSGFIPPNTRQVDYIDYSVLSFQQSYTYKYLVIDKCNNASGISNTGRTILLRALAQDGFVNKLNWNSYAEWDGGVGKYRLFRSLDQGQNFVNIGEFDADTSFIDIVANEVDSLMEFCYYVEAVESEINSFGVRDTSRSNKVCVIQKPTVWIPNAFRPTNLQGNNIFKAQGLYEKLAINHNFSIYNRWGELLFATGDPTEGWNGTYQNAYVQSGIYVYTLKFALPDGSSVNRKGAVMLLD
ncbi:MAG: gliding motility-associated C-terminal domain-containing protein [Bacteroidia bacterium]